jgi:2-amino-4-hydroxy-6-hydroxymethyldihydropteridine diphosphokinase
LSNQARWQSVEKGGKLLKSNSLMIVAVGSNQRAVEGRPDVIVREAISAIENRGAMIRKISKFYQTPCFPVGAGPDYINAAVLIEVPWSPEETLEHLHAVEAQFGRERVQRWGQRTLDLDLIANEDVVSPSLAIHDQWRNLDIEIQKTTAPTELIIPHPRVQDRAFVLIPLMDIAPDWMHPVLGKNVSEMLDALPAVEKVAVIPLNAQQ